MTLTGPQKIPFASQSEYYGGVYQGSAMEVNVGLLHTTEGTSLVSYGNGSEAPNVTAVPDFVNQKLRWYQHYDVDRSSRALVNAAGGVETNTLNVFQIELVGTCDPATHTRWLNAGVRHIYWPEAPDWALAEVGVMVRWLHDNHNIPMTCGVTFKGYPASYGSGNGVRLSGSQWSAYTGWLGHQHVPENYHGDPGSIDIDKILAFAAGTEEDVAITKADVNTIVNTDDLIRSPHDTTDTNKFWTLASYERETYLKAEAAADAVARVEAKVDALAVGGVDLDALAAKVADLLAARLQS